jgi:hypothetical protein
MWVDHLGELDEVRFAGFGRLLFVLEGAAFECAAGEVDARFLQLDAYVLQSSGVVPTLILAC